MTIPITNINVIRDFSYTITTSSITYIRNYNFNPITTTPIEILLQNKSEQVPITVDISASHPWVSIINPANNRSVVTPEGNVVLPTSSSRVVLMKIDLPPEIEALSDSNVQVSMSFYLRSGSFPRDSSDTTGTSASNLTRIELAEDIMYIKPAEIRQNLVRTYENGILVTYVPLTFFIEDETIASTGQQYETDGGNINVINVEGIKDGTTRLRVIWQQSEEKTITAEATIIVTSATNAGGGGGGGGDAGGEIQE